MRLSTKGRYGLRAMLDLAIHYSEGLIKLNGIAGRQGISESYLEQILYTLKKFGLVNSTRGHQGGYTLSKNPEEITVSMILDALEGEIAPVHCIDDCTPFNCPRVEVCASKRIWEQVRKSIYSVTDSTTLKELAEEQILLEKRLVVNNVPDKNLKDEFSLIILRSANKTINNLAFRGKWLIFNEKYPVKENELVYSVALTEKDQLFVLTENKIQVENSGYSIYPTLDHLKSSNLLPCSIINLISITLKKDEEITILDI